MASRRMEFFIGMMVIGIIAGVFVMTILFGSDRGFFVGGNGGKRMTIVFEKGGGISQNSLVLKKGIRIGRVYSVELIDNEEQSEVHVSFELDPEAKIFSNEYAKINRTFLGDASIEFVDNPDYKGEIYEIGVDDVIPGKNTGDLMGTVNNIEGDLAQALDNVNKATAGVTLFMQNLNTFLGDEQELQQKKERLQEVFTDLNDAFVSIKNLTSHIDVIASDEEIVNNVRQATNEVPKIVSRLDELSGKASQFMDNANEMSADVRTTLARAETTFDLVDKNLDNVNVFTTSLAENGPEMMTALNESSAEIKGAIDDIKGAIQNIAVLAGNLSDKLDDPDSPIGMLTDKEMAEELRHIVRNVDELTEKLYPVFDDARVFSNKIAHRPSSLIWDKTTSKGGSLSDKYGWQSLSPNGGLSSPLYRRTPTGAKIRSRNQYKPSADVDYMDTETRVAYENELHDRNIRENYPEGVYEEAAASLGGSQYSDVLPEATLPMKTSRWNKWNSRFNEQKSRVRWSLASFWDKLAPKRSNAFKASVIDSEYEFPNAYDAQFVGYESYPDMNGGIDQAIYMQGGAFASENGAFVDPNGVQVQFVPNDQFQAVSQATGTQEATPQFCPPDSPQALGAYVGEEPEKLDFSLNQDCEQIEELPSSINRRVSTEAKSSTGGAFEDDGLPLQFAPPTRR